MLTVFTPTYNRAATLARVYESLQRQTFRDFEWLIVDDGSEDETAELVERWRSTCSFPIRYLWQPNQGKHVAFNRGVELAQGEYGRLSRADGGSRCRRMKADPGRVFRASRQPGRR